MIDYGQILYELVNTFIADLYEDMEEYPEDYVDYTVEDLLEEFIEFGVSSD